MENACEIKIKRNLSFNDIDNYYRELNTSIVEGCNLLIPKEIVNNQFGIHGALILFYITWYRKTKDSIIILDTDSSHIDEIEDFVNKTYNFSILTLGFNRGIFNNRRERLDSIIVPFVRKKLEEIEKKLCWRRGDHSFIISIEKSLNPYVRAFYYNNSLRDRTWFNGLTKHLVSETLNKSSKNLSKMYLENEDLNDKLSRIIYELVENVNYWGRTDKNNKLLDSGLFTLMISNHNNFGGRIEQDNSALNNYILSLKSNDEYANLLEITIIDSGVGLAARYMECEIDTFTDQSEIIKAIYDCMKINNSSDKSSAFNRGFGYDRVFKMLSQTIGFLEIRSNGIKLYRDFKLKPFDSTDFKMDVYQSKGTSKVVTRNDNCGTQISLFIPLKSL